MRISPLILALLLCSCSGRPKEGFAVVDNWGSVVLRTQDEEEARRLSGKLTLMGRALSSKPQYFVFKGRED